MYDDVSFARVVSGNDGLDMNIEVPANIARAPGPGLSGPGQGRHQHGLQRPADRRTASRWAAGFSKPATRPIRNGLFSISAKTVLPRITVQQAGRSYVCDLSDGGSDGRYRCE